MKTKSRTAIQTIQTIFAHEAAPATQKRIARLSTPEQSPPYPANPTPEPWSAPARPQLQAPSSSSGFFLRNDCGFWHLSIRHRSAVVPQHQALFYVARIFASPSASPISAPILASQVADDFRQHPDFDVPTALPDPPSSGISELASPEPIGRRPPRGSHLAHRPLLPASSPVHRAGTDALPGVPASTVLPLLLSLYATLAAALDARHMPSQVLRAFSRHLLLCLIIPSIRASAKAQASCFAYLPPPGVTWDISVRSSHF